MYDSIPYSIASAEVIHNELLNESVYKGPIQLQYYEYTVELVGEIIYSLFPRPQLLFQGVAIKGKTFDFMKINNWELLIESGLTGSVSINSIGFKSSKEGSKFIIQGEFNYEISEKGLPSVKKICFSVINFINNRGQFIRYKDRIYNGRLKMEYKGFMIIFDKITGSKEVFNTLKANGGFAITHIGQISRVDKKTFEIEEIEELLDNLMWILSFVAGRQVGFSHIYQIKEGKWHTTHYRTPRVAEWKQHSNWYPLKSSDKALENVITSLLNLMEDDFWKEQIPILLSGYFDSIGPSYIENKIIILQAALETLSWSYLVEETNTITSKEFNSRKMSASEKIRLLLSEFNIDTSIEKIPELKENSGQFDDGPHLFTAIRNDLVHPKKCPKKLNGDQLYYVWRLGVVYFELAVLAIAKYSGVYQDLLMEPTSEAKMIKEVPWL